MSFLHSTSRRPISIASGKFPAHSRRLGPAVDSKTCLLERLNAEREHAVPQWQGLPTSKAATEDPDDCAQRGVARGRDGGIRQELAAEVAPMTNHHEDSTKPASQCRHAANMDWLREPGAAYASAFYNETGSPPAALAGVLTVLCPRPRRDGVR